MERGMMILLSIVAMFCCGACYEFPAGTKMFFEPKSKDQLYWWSRGVGLVQYMTDTWAAQPSAYWALESYKVQEK